MPVFKSIDQDDDDKSDDSIPTIACTASTIGFGDISSGDSGDKELDQVAPHICYKKVQVTGCAGFIGSNVAELLLPRGDDVLIVDEMND